MNTLLEIHGLKKRFGQVEAVKGIDLRIPEGVCFGLLGPNGAGKTTSIEIMEGIQSPDAGDILFRQQPIDKTFRQKVGIQFQHTALPEFITVKETLEMFGAFYPETRPMDELIGLCSLEDIIDRDNQKLSGGQKQRMLLALAILPKPEIVFLDEPTTGLDPQSRRNFWELIRGIKAENTTVLLTTHYMDEAQALCDEIAIMDHGHIIEQGTPLELLERHFRGALISIPTEQQLEPNELQTLIDTLSAKLNQAQISNDKGRLTIQTEELDLAVRGLLDGGVNIDGLNIHKPDLEDLFIKLTGSSLRA